MAFCFWRIECNVNDNKFGSIHKSFYSLSLQKKKYRDGDQDPNDASDHKKCKVTRDYCCMVIIILLLIFVSLSFIILLSSFAYLLHYLIFNGPSANYYFYCSIGAQKLMSWVQLEVFHYKCKIYLIFSVIHAL